MNAPIEAKENAERPADRPAARLGLAALERAVRSVEPAALLVSPRILRRVIKVDSRPSGFALSVPHRKSYVIEREPLLEIVDRAELGLDAEYALPAEVILLTRPDPQLLAAMTAGEALLRYWRMLLHARVHVALRRRIAEGKLNAAAIRRRVYRIGATEFDEIRTVLQQEGFLLPPRDDLTVYVEFAAVYIELRYFAQSFLSRYFPSIKNFAALETVLAEDLDARGLFLAMRPPGAPDPDDRPGLNGIDQWPLQSEPVEDEAAAVGHPSSEKYHRLTRRARRPALLGNVVRSAIFRARAEQCAPPELAEAAHTALKSDIAHLIHRLRVALELDGQSPQDWQASLFALVRQTPRGIWTAEARLLYDLQKVCVDHERAIYTVDVVEWALSWGKRPIKRPLPSQRDVLMCKHLRSAARRLAAVRLTGAQRQQLALLIGAATARVERRIRDRFRPLVSGALQEVGLRPQNLPETVAVRKLVEELLDHIVERGFLNMGGLRDALSRNNLKLPDVASPVDFLRGDPLLRADRRLAVLLDGVYHHGEFYLRWLQRFSALSFGTRTGRFLTRYVAVPFGGAALALGGVEWLIEEGFKHKISLMGPEQILPLGALLFALIHIGFFRRGAWQVLKTSGRVLRRLVVDPLVWIVRSELLQTILHSRAFRIGYRFVLKPLLWTMLFWFVFPLAGINWRSSAGSGVSIFLTINLLLNSRVGRSLEEMVSDWLVQTWQRYGLRLLSGLFYLVIDFFKAGLEAIERLMYSVDEWLRFKSGQGRLALVAKAVLGVVWFYVAYVLRFCITLLIEPQVNPIKHFPVVTVSHKLLLPFYKPFGRILAWALNINEAFGIAIGATIIFSIPGIFGFLVWELKENWRLYAANRPDRLKPIPIGPHGETMARLLKPGLHSGTIPKRYAKLRRAERQARVSDDWKAARKHLEALNRVELSVRRYLDREFLTLLAESRCWATPSLSLDSVHLGTNCVRVALQRAEQPGAALTISLETQAGWLVAGVDALGWTRDLSPEQRQALSTAIIGLYKSAGVDLVRQQIEREFLPPVAAYDFTRQGLVVLPDETFDVEVLYDLRDGEPIAPRVTAGLPRRTLPIFGRAQAIFSEVPVWWQRWVEVWQQDQAGQCHRCERVAPVRILPGVESE